MIKLKVNYTVSDIILNPYKIWEILTIVNDIIRK